MSTRGMMNCFSNKCDASATKNLSSSENLSQIYREEQKRIQISSNKENQTHCHMENIHSEWITSSV